MSDNWVEYVINKMIEPTANQATREIGVKLQLLYLKIPNLFTKYVNAIDKSTGEIWFMKLNNF